MSGVGAFLKKNVALYPLIAVVGGACALCVGHMARNTFSGHVATWSKDNFYPWNNIQQTQNIKYMGLQGDYKESEVFRPQAADDLRGRL